MEPSHPSNCLKLVIGSWDPYVTVTNYTPPYEIAGVAVIILRIIMKKLGYCYYLARAPDNDWGYPLPNGSWTGTIGMLRRKEADMSAAVYLVSDSRARAVDFSEAIFFAEQSCAYMRPRITSDIASIIKPYTPAVWAGIFLCLLLVMAVNGIIDQVFNVYVYYDRNASADIETPRWSIKGLDRPSFWIFSILLLQPLPWVPRGDSVRTLGSVWLLLSFILSTVYRSNLMAMLIAPKVTLPFNSFEELGKTDAQLFHAKGSLLYDALRAAQEGDLLKKVQKNFITFDSTPYGVQGFFQGKWGVTSSRDTLLFGLHRDFSQHGYCNFYIMADSIFRGTPVAYAFPQNSPLKPKTDRIIRNLKEFGITDYLMSKMTFNASECLKPIGMTVSNVNRPLEMGDLYSAFIILLSGIFLSTLAFIMEIVLPIIVKTN